MDLSKFDTDAEYYHLNGVWFPAVLHPKHALDACQDFQFQDGDIFSCTYPKTGEHFDI